jgi:restriction system protein
VVETGGRTRDGGVDLVLRKGNETHLVQCKQWRAMAVGVETVRELYGVMAAKGATGGYVVTSGRFSADARKFAEGRNIHLLDGEALAAMIGRTRAPGGAVAPTEAIGEQGAAARCPRCGGPMVRRIAQKGSNAGKPFWGCAEFPNCKGIENMDA